MNSELPPSPDAAEIVARNSLSARTGRSPRLALLEAAFTNWRVPGYLGSLAYRARRFSPALFDRLMGTRLVLRTRQGPSLVARLRDVNGPAEVFGLGEYESRWVDWSRVEYVLDAGGHVGGFTLWAAIRTQCRIIALEPNPSTRALLETNVRRHRLDDRVSVRPWALAATAGPRQLRPAADSAATALVGESAAGDLDVEAVTLAEAISASGFPRIDLLKMDIEGAEHEVFNAVDAATLRLVDCWIIECHPVPGTTQETIAQVLTAAGFQVATTGKPLGQALLIAKRLE